MLYKRYIAKDSYQQFHIMAKQVEWMMLHIEALEERETKMKNQIYMLEGKIYNTRRICDE